MNFPSSFSHYLFFFPFKKNHKPVIDLENLFKHIKLNKLVGYLKLLNLMEQ